MTTPLTVAEARAILAVDKERSTRTSAPPLSNEEREAWDVLLKSAIDRVAAFNKKAGYTVKRLTDEDAAEIAELLRVSIDDKGLLSWHQRLREIREKMIRRLGDVVEESP